LIAQYYKLYNSASNLTGMVVIGVGYVYYVSCALFYIFALLKIYNILKLVICNIYHLIYLRSYLCCNDVVEVEIIIRTIK